MFKPHMLLATVIVAFLTTAAVNVSGQVWQNTSLSPPPVGLTAEHQRNRPVSADVASKNEIPETGRRIQQFSPVATKTEQPPPYPSPTRQQRTYLSRNAKIVLITAAIAGVVIVSAVLQRNRRSGGGIIGPRF